jgi:hypothetical protein
MINLNDSRIMSTKEAAEKWGFKDDSTIRKRITEFPPGTARKFGKQWVVTEEGMLVVFGEPRKEKEQMKNVKRIGFYAKKVAEFPKLPEHRKELRKRRLFSYKRAMHARFETEE